MFILGKEIAEKEIYPQLKSYREKFKISPILAIFFNPKDKVGEKFIKAKQKSASKAGIKIQIFYYSTIKQTEEQIAELNNNPKISGIILQLPLPSNYRQEIIYSIHHFKDVDGFYSNFFMPPVVRAVERVLKEVPFWQEKKILVVGQGPFFGKKIYHFLKRKAHNIEAVDNEELLPVLLKKSEIIISCVGKPGLINENNLSKSFALIDVGTSVVKDKIIGDISLKLKNRTEFFVPTPGGIGPLTIAYLMDNVWQAFLRQNNV